ncbi:MAG: hypothetical protein ACK5RQ_10495 [Bacteroidota bacterium]
MKKLCTIAGLLCCLLAGAQKKVMTYPFEFEKSFLAKSDYDAYFLDNKANETFALILKDNKKADYVLIDKNFATLSRISMSLENSILDNDRYSYIGGTSNGSSFYFLYHEARKEIFALETVDFTTKKTTHREILDIPKGEDFITVFSYNNFCYIFSVNPKTSQLLLRVLNNTGILKEHVLNFTVPEVAKRMKLDDYLRNIRVFKEDEEPDFSAAVRSKKLFCSPEELKIVINTMDHPTHIYTIQLPTLITKEQFVDYSDVITAKEKGQLYVNAYAYKDVLYSLLLNKENIRLTLHDLEKNGKLISNFEMNEDHDNYEILAATPVTESRIGKKVIVKDVTRFNQLVRRLTNGREGIMVEPLTNGNLMVRVGTYDLIVLGGSYESKGYWVGGLQSYANERGGNTIAYNSMLYYRPGTTSYTRTDARNYEQTYFKYMLDPVTLKPVKGRVPEEVGRQIKDYIEDVDKKAKARNQFSIGKNQYYGYYQPELKTYIIEQIKIL